jgi:hypothetical protein
MKLFLRILCSGSGFVCLSLLVDKHPHQIKQTRKPGHKPIDMYGLEMVKARVVESCLKNSAALWKKRIEFKHVVLVSCLILHEGNFAYASNCRHFVVKYEANCIFGILEKNIKPFKHTTISTPCLFYQNHQTKDGSSISIREASPGDATAVINMIKDFRQCGVYIVTRPEGICIYGRVKETILEKYQSTDGHL